MIERLPQLHVFGRVAPEDKVRLARLMQESGQVVAMTGDAVNDAAALKQADIGVAMGSGSEVTKQAAKIVLTDDNFATLVRAVDLGRDIYRRITSYVKLQLTVLSSVLQLMLLATIFNINGGVALFPMQLLFCKFFVVVTVVVGFIADVPDPSVMQRPPRKPGTRIVTRPQVVRWLVSGFVIACIALAVLQWGPDQPSTTDPSVSMTMAFAIVALSAVNLGSRACAANASRRLVVAGVPVLRMDHPRLGPDLGRRSSSTCCNDSSTRYRSPGVVAHRDRTLDRRARPSSASTRPSSSHARTGPISTPPSPAQSQSTWPASGRSMIADGRTFAT